MSSYIQDTEQALLHTYNRFPVVLKKGEGVYLIDENAKKYLDFAAGIAVCGLGYGNAEFKNALKAQVDDLLHTSNLYYNVPCAEGAKALKKASQMDRVFFTNSGTEAIEGIIKAARKYAYTKKSGRYEIIAMEDSFHGRTMGALSVTGTESYRTPFEPLVPGVRFAKFNDLDSVKALVSEKTCAILLEPIQGEGGIHPATEAFMSGIREICDAEDILMLCDEIQCGMGRSGHMFAWQGYGVKPDLMAMAKAIGNGIPVGAFAMTERVAESSLAPGDHGTTYGGNPLACTAVSTVLRIFEKEHIAEHAKEMGEYLRTAMERLMQTNPFITGVRGTGLIQGIEVTKPAGNVSAAALEEGLIIISAKGNVMRLVPPLVIEKSHVDEMAEKLDRALRNAKE